MSETPPSGSAMPDYKGAPLDSERGPGLGCFWFQVGLLVALLVLTPLSVAWAWPSMVSAALLILSLVLLFFVGQTMIFLLRLVAADRRSRRRPMSSTARPTVGDLENASNKDDMMTLVLDVPAGIQSRDALLALYADKLRFPDYFGNNWDAFEECLRDLSWLREHAVRIVHADQPLSADSAATRTYSEILRRAVTFWHEKAAHSLTVDFASDEDDAGAG